MKTAPPEKRTKKEERKKNNIAGKGIFRKALQISGNDSGKNAGGKYVVESVSQNIKIGERYYKIIVVRD